VREEGGRVMKKWGCAVCGYVYDPEADDDNGMKIGVEFDDLPDSWTCPDCGTEKDQFEPFEG
jgi:rubredoxin